VSFVQQAHRNDAQEGIEGPVVCCAGFSVRYLSLREMGAQVCIFLLGMGQLAVLQHKAQTRF